MTQVSLHTYKTIDIAAFAIENARVLSKKKTKNLEKETAECVATRRLQRYQLFCKCEERHASHFTL